jgi:hypothetical protein
MKQTEGKPAKHLRDKLRWIGALQAAVAIVAIMFVWTNAKEDYLLLGLSLLAAATAGWIGFSLPNQIARQQAAQADQLRQDFLRIFSHYRHDVMNHVQLIKGYLQLKKFDRLESPLQNIIQDAQRHSLLSNVPGTQLPYFLVDRDVSSPMVRLQVEVDPLVRDCIAGYEPTLIRVLRTLFAIGESLQQGQGYPMHWRLQIVPQERELALNLHVSGEHVNDTYIESVKQSLTRNGFSWKETTVENNLSILTLHNGKLGEIKCS